MKLRSALYTAFLPALALTATARVASAQDELSGSAGVEHGSRFPVQYVDRPLVMPTKMLGLNLGLAIAHTSMETGPESDTAVALAGGAVYGLMDNLEVGAVVLPLLISPKFEYGTPNIYGMYRFLDQGGLELGAMVELDLGVRSGTNTALMLGVPLAYHFGHAARLDSGVFVGFDFADDETMTMPQIPLRLHFQATNNIAAGVATGVTIPKFDFEMSRVPLSIDAIYSIPMGSMPMADIGVSFGFPLFLTPGTDGDKLHADLWALTLFGTYYMDL